jgi:flagellar protein FliO/FliZ
MKKTLENAMDNYLLELLFMILALILVVAMAWFVLKGIKRFHSAHGDGSKLKLSLSLPVGAREQIIVMTYRENEYLVGITPGGMRLLDKLPINDDANRSTHRSLIPD